MESVCFCILVNEVTWISTFSVVRGGEGIRLDDVSSGITISEEEEEEMDGCEKGGDERNDRCDPKSGLIVVDCVYCKDVANVLKNS